MRTLRFMLVVGVALSVSGSCLAYSQMEIIRILLAGIRSRDPAVQRAVVLVRQQGLLEARTRSLGQLARVAETPRVLDALTLLSERGFLPDAQLTPRAIADYVGQVATLQEEEQRERELSRQKATLLRLARTNRRAPFYVYLTAQKAFILGGLLKAGAELEMTCARPDGFAEVLFPSIHRGFVLGDHLDPLERDRASAVQDESQVEVIMERPVQVARASHGGARLRIVTIDLRGDDGPILVPYVTGRYNKVRPGSEPVEYVHDVGRKTGAAVAVNGTFFINSPGGRGHGTPLAPIILNGQVAWSYNEKRVLDMNRAYLAITGSNRVVSGETNLMADQILSLSRQRRFNPAGFKGESLRHLLGGLGWLVRHGDREAWRRVAGRQFGYSYYSHYVKRPQTILAVSADGRRVWIVAQEGMPHSARPLSLPKLADYAVENFGARDVVFLDGGGSTELVVRGQVETRQENDGPYRPNSTMLLVLGGRG